MKSSIIIIFTLLFTTLIDCENKSESAPVISRNSRIEEMIEGLKVQNEFYEEMINGTMRTL